VVIELFTMPTPCVANPNPCLLIGIAEPGDPRLPALGADLDIRTDLGRYRGLAERSAGG